MDGKEKSLAEKGYYPPSLVVNRTQFHKTTIYRWIKDGRIETLKFNGRYYVKWDSVKELMKPLEGVLDLSEPIVSESSPLPEPVTAPAPAPALPPVQKVEATKKPAKKKNQKQSTLW
jgi:excisionase family DNA binding protein